MARTKKTESTPVRIRYKELNGGNKSIYLDIYYRQKRWYEFLKLYLIPETTSEARRQNENTLKAANAIRAQRILDLANNRVSATNAEKAKTLFVDYIDEYVVRGTQNGKRALATHYHSTQMIIKRFDPKVRICDIDKDWFDGFLEFLDKTTARRTKQPYAKRTKSGFIIMITSVLSMAVDDGIIDVNPGLAVKHELIQGAVKVREYLTIEEVQSLISTECPRPVIKDAFLFACFCGLRLCDIRDLRWKNIVQEEDGKYHIEVKQNKTQRMVYIPMNQNARGCLPKQEGLPNDSVFDLPHIMTVEKWLKRWAAAAGITKNLTFHMSRHSFATMELTLGADLYTTSQLMGHADVESTQIYAKIIDAKKIEAVYMIDKLFDDALNSNN